MYVHVYYLPFVNDVLTINIIIMTASTYRKVYLAIFTTNVFNSTVMPYCLPDLFTRNNVVVDHVAPFSALSHINLFLLSDRLIDLTP